MNFINFKDADLRFFHEAYKRCLPGLLLAFIFQFSNVDLNAQQDEVIFKHYVLNHIMVNPAAAGFNEAHELRFNMRNQFAGFPGAPTTLAVGYNGPIGNTFGLGFNLLSEDIASLNRNRLQVTSAFRFEIGQDVKLNVGFSTEFHQMRIAQGARENPLFDEGDLLLIDAEDGIQIIDASLGIYGRVKENTFFSLTIPNLVKARLNGSVPSTFAKESGFLQYFMMMAGHRAYLKKKPIYIEPSMMISRVINTPTIFDLNVRAGLSNEKLSAGLTFRTGPSSSVGFMVGTKINVLQVFYSYDSHMGDLSAYHQGSHEVTLGFSFGSKPRTVKESKLDPK